MSYPAQSAQSGQPQATQAQIPMQAPVIQAVAVPLGNNVTIQQIELQTKASSVFRLWCCSLVFGIITLISGLAAGGQHCTNNDGNVDYTFCDGKTVWRLYAPGIAFGGVLTVLSILALRALHCNSCSYNLDIASYDLKTLRPLLWIALIPGLGLLIWSAIYLIAFNYFALVLFPYFIPCWAGCVLGIVTLVQACCCQRQMVTTMDSLRIVGNGPPSVVVQSQFVQYQPQQGYAQPYGQQQFVPQQQGMQPQYYAPVAYGQQQQFVPQQQYAQQQQQFAPQQYAQQQFAPQQQQGTTGDSN